MIRICKEHDETAIFEIINDGAQAYRRAAATWAIRFYERHGFVLVPPPMKDELLPKYWTVPERQREISVVLDFKG